MESAVAGTETPCGTLCRLRVPKQAQGAGSVSHGQGTNFMVSAAVGAMTRPMLRPKSTSGATAPPQGSPSQATLYQVQMRPMQVVKWVVKALFIQMGPSSLLWACR